jgi:hypothetical protein
MNTKRKEILTPVLDKLTKGITIECRKDVIISKERVFPLYSGNIITNKPKHLRTFSPKLASLKLASGSFTSLWGATLIHKPSPQQCCRWGGSLFIFVSFMFR